MQCEAVYKYSREMPRPYTLAKLTCFGATIYAQCQCCGHFSVLEHARLTEIGLEKLVEDVQARMRCRVCSRKRCQLITERPNRGERECATCGQPSWKPTPMDVARNAKRCHRCGKPLLRD